MPLEMDDDLMDDAGRRGGRISFSDSDDDDIMDDVNNDVNDDNKATRLYDSNVNEIMKEEDALGDDDREERGGDAVVIVL